MKDLTIRYFARSGGPGHRQRKPADSGRTVGALAEATDEPQRCAARALAAGRLNGDGSGVLPACERAADDLAAVASHTAAVLFPAPAVISHLYAMDRNRRSVHAEVNPEISAPQPRKAFGPSGEPRVKLGTAGAANIRATVEKAQMSAARCFARKHEALFCRVAGTRLTPSRPCGRTHARGIAAAKGGEWTHGHGAAHSEPHADWKAADSAQA
ncbi:hypothetical protein FQR65_LT20541 [Abscondita terminalis]|nr:hypothetical protein FQR65_LT20541 [Abscondita terminalis]